MPTLKSTPPEERFGKIIVSIWKQVRRKREEDEYAYLSQQFDSKVDGVVNHSRHVPISATTTTATTITSRRQALLPVCKAQPTTSSLDPNTGNVSNNKKTPKLQRVVLVGALEPVCPHTGRLHLTKSYPVSDSRELTFVPSAFADADDAADETPTAGTATKPTSTSSMEDYFALFDVGARERAITDGPLYHVQEINEDISETMRRCLGHKVYQEEVVQGGTINQEQVAHYLVTTLARLADVDEDRIQKLYEIVENDYLAALEQQQQQQHSSATAGNKRAGIAKNKNKATTTTTTTTTLLNSTNSKDGDMTAVTAASTATTHSTTTATTPGSPRRKNDGNAGRLSEDRAASNSKKLHNSASKLHDNNSDVTSTATSSPTPYAGPLCQPVAATMADDEDQPPRNRLAEDDPDYLKLVDSYRKLYCNRCKMYDCAIHGLVEKPSLQLSYEVGITAERDRKRPGSTSNRGLASSTATTNSATTSLLLPSLLAAANQTTNQQQDQSKQGRTENQQHQHEPNGHATKFTDFHKKICRRFFLIFEGDTNQMAEAMRANPEHVKAYVEDQGWTQPTLRLVPPIKAETNPYHSLRNYNQHWYSRIVKSGLRPAFEPCVHDEPCREGICDCVERSIFCTDACAWGSRSKNFFRGCDCRSSCTTSNCSCFANSRECNPDLCRCDTCTDPPNRSAQTQRCRNDNLSMHRGTEIVIGKSEVPKAGWGAFAKRALAKGDFLGEYVGEMISQEEADRRGQLYDIRNHSSLFMLTADVALDADRKGNLMRYINHSATPNTTPRTITVNGDNRIGFFALQDIEAQTELTFNYGYNFSVNNDFVLKAAKAVPWMEVPAIDPSSNGNSTNNHLKKGTQSKRKSSKPTARATSLKGGKKSESKDGDGPLDILGDIDATTDL